jgi:vitamin B12 transporter
MSLLLLIAATAQPVALPGEGAGAPACGRAPEAAACPPPSDMIVTAARIPVPAAEAPASATLFDQERIERLGPVQAIDLVRLAPGTSVSVSGAQGAQAQVRIRGAEANHTLVFIDGIAFNDLAAGNQARFETFTADTLGRLEVVRGPQSALWGSEALGGVIALSSPDPLGERRAAAMAELGSREFLRLSGGISTGGDGSGISATASYVRSEGIDILGSGAGDRDDFENLTLGARGLVRFGDGFEAGLAGRYIHHDAEFDGSDPVTFARADTADASVAETVAGRVWLGYGSNASPWQLVLEAQHLDSRNRNRNADVRTNDSYGRRTRFGAQAVHRFQTGNVSHLLVAAAEREEEEFGTRDLQFGGASDRDLERSRTAFIGEWRAQWGDAVTTDVAVRHDDFSAFEDATTIRVRAEVALGASLSLIGGYGEGIAQPSFVDLFGFGPGSGFIGNPNLRPERSSGYEAGLRWTRPALTVEAVAFSSDLVDEIVEDFSAFPNYTVVNVPGDSRRRGIELSGEWRPSDALRIGANYTYLDTREPDAGAGDALREVRRPEHSANLYVDWRSDRVTLGGSLAYVGARVDRDFDLFPAPRVELGAYALASARVAFRLGGGVEAFARVENALDENYQDLVGYAAPGRSVHAGLRLSLGR